MVTPSFDGHPNQTQAESRQRKVRRGSQTFPDTDRKDGKEGRQSFFVVVQSGAATACSCGQIRRKALATAGLSFGVDKDLKKIFGKGYGPREVELYRLTQMLSPDEKGLLKGTWLEREWFAAEEPRSMVGFLGCWLP